MTPPKEDGSMLSELTVNELLERTAAGTPLPGGGSLSALVAAVGASLAQMVAMLTAGRSKFAAVDEDMRSLAEKAHKLRQELLVDMDRDAAAYDAVMAALRLPQKTEAEQQRRSEAVQTAIKDAARVPLAVAEKALAVMALARTAVRSGNPNAASDGAVGAMLARAALQGALFNVRINLRDLQDQAFSIRLRRAAEELAGRAEALEREILAAITF
jgi:formiminotetrahydrofolate cyclodeaminase